MYAGALWAARHWYRKDALQSAKISSILKDIYAEFGLKSRLVAPLVGRYVRWMMAREERRIRRGWMFEPPTFCETANCVECGADQRAVRPPHAAFRLAKPVA
jgi:hypothetical protein